MVEPDYYTVMEKRIRYFACRYDPLNRYLPEGQKPYKISHLPEKQEKTKKKKSFVNFILSLFF